MGKPGSCVNHGVQVFVTVSARLKLAMKQGIFLTKDDFCRVEILSGDAKSKNIFIMDAKVIKSLRLNITDNKVNLRDRDKSTKTQHDRLVIRQLFDKQRDNWLCSECFRLKAENAFR
jgi:hypothetical protein